MRLVVVIALLSLQSDPQAAALKDLGSGYSVIRVEPGILLALPGAENESSALLQSIRRGVKAYRTRILDVAPQDSLLLILFGSAENYRAYTSQRYPGPVPQTTFYDVPNRRVLLRTEATAAYAQQSARTFLLTDSLNGNAVPPWIASSLSLLDDPDPEPATFDHRAALLREAQRRGALPGLRAYFALDLSAFHSRAQLTLHASIALKFAAYLESKDALKKFFEEYRRNFRKDATGAAAVEVALGSPLEGIEKDFFAYIKTLPWLHRERFLEQARSVFGPEPLVQVDEDLMLAVTGNVEPRVTNDALDAVRKLREPLIRMLGLKPSGLPVLARLFKDQASFQEYARVDAPHQQWLGGYFSYESRWLVLHLEPDSGSLSHEYCHSLIEDDVGILPPWFSEGLASLFERYKLEGGVPVGERGSTLRDVRVGLLQNRVPTLDVFVGYRGRDFYDPERVRLNYDIARALLLFLQEKNALVGVYKEVQRAKAAGTALPPVALCRAALEKVLGAKTEKINDDFRAWLSASRD
jgi:hypothetical protein